MSREIELDLGVLLSGLEVEGLEQNLFSVSGCVDFVVSGVRAVEGKFAVSAGEECFYNRFT